MALFKISKGSIDNLSNQAKVDGYAWFTPADGKFYIDAVVDGTLQRVPLNAKKADILSTARTINGTSFDGSANIITTNWGTARMITIGDTGKNIDGSEAVSWSLAEIGVPTKTSELTNDSGFITSAPVTSVNNKTGMVSLTASDVNAVPLAGGTMTGQLKTTNKPIYAYTYGANKNLAAIVWDKPGSYQTGVGSHNTTNTIWFGPCDSDGTWQDSYTSQIWHFNGTVDATNFTGVQKTYTFTLGTSWSGSSAPYTQAVTVSGILATDTPILDLVTTTSGYEDEETAWGNVFKAVTSANTITFYAKDATTTSITVQAKVVR